MKIKERFNPENLFFTADTHFYHTNIIKYCNRPFKDQYEMCNVIRENWNNKVPPEGIIFHLGDVSLRGRDKELFEFLSSLNGSKHLIIGNHERDVINNKKIRELFITVADLTEIFVKDEEIEYNEQHLVLSHYPHISWPASHRGSWELFGHVHGMLNDKNVLKGIQLDVGVDCHNFTPLSYQEVKEIITKQCLNK